MRIRKFLIVLGSCALCLLLVLGTIAYGLSSAAGLRFATELAQRLSGGRLSLGETSGCLLGPLDLSSLTWQDEQGRWQLEQIHLDWQAEDLLAGRLHIRELTIARISGENQPDPTPPSLPTSLRLPLTVQVDALQIGRLNVGQLPALEEIRLVLHSDGQTYRVPAGSLKSQGIALSLNASLAAEAPFDLQAQANLQGQLETHPLNLLIEADGPLSAPRLHLRALAGIEGEGQVQLAPFSAQILSQARLNLRNIDPAAWVPGAPQARLDLELDLRPQAGQGFAGPLRLHNRQPGRLDQGALPLHALSGDLQLDPQQARLSGLHIELPGKASLSGQSHYGNGQLSLSLEARQLDLARLHARLYPTRLQGRLQAELGAARQALSLALSDRQFDIAAEIAHREGQLNLKQLRLTAGPARLEAQGEQRLGGRRSFSADGRLSNFDPARFGRFPSARLNLAWAARGQLGDGARTPWQVDGRFTLQESRLAGQALSGEGTIQTDGEHALRSDLHIQAGANRLQAQGRLGRPGDRLSVDIDAPALKPYGINGSLKGQIELRGALARPGISLHLHSPLLQIPNLARLEALQLDAQFSPDPAAPLRLALQLGKLGFPEQPELLRQWQLSLQGSLGQHQIASSVDIEQQHKLQLSARGGLTLKPNWRWQGQLLELGVTSPMAAREFALREAASLDVGELGGQIGPLRLRGKALDWQAELVARSSLDSLNLKLSAAGGRLGRLGAELQSTNRAAWRIDPQKPWRGRAELHSDDLAWLGELLGDGWQSGGQLQAEMRLGGTADQPLLDGQVIGQQLLLKRPEQGLSLNRGQLTLHIERNLLRVRQARFESLLQPAPRALQQREGLGQLTQTPGQISLQGELRLEGEHETGWLDWRLERLGALQTADQWLLLSGMGRIDWQSGKLGARGQINADAGYWALAPSGAPSLSEDVVIRRSGEAVPTTARPHIELDLQIGLGKHFLFSGAGLNARLDGDLRLRASGRDLPRASGSIRVRDGRFEAYGQRLEIERGNLNFQGLPDNPALDVRALRKGFSVEAGVQVSGTAQRPIVKLVSDPEVPDAEKLAWLVLGHGPEQMSAGDASLLLGAASGLLGNNAGGLVQQLRQRFGFDEFGVRQGALGDNGNRRTSSRVAGSGLDSSATTSQQIFSVGKRLSSNTVLAYEQALGKAESIVKLTVNLSRSIALVGRAGSDNAIDLFWTRRFGGRAEDSSTRSPP